MPYVNPLSGLGFALGISNWASIKAAGIQLMAECLKRGKSSGGEFFVADTTSTDPVLTIYMWASGAKFEAELNQYENNPTSAAPLSQPSLGELNGNESIDAGAMPLNTSLNESIIMTSGPASASNGSDESIATS